MKVTPTNATCTKCGSNNTKPMRKVLLHAGLAMIAIGVILFFLAPLCIPLGLICIISSFFYKGNGHWCESCKSNFKTDKLQRGHYYYCGDCKRHRETVDYNTKQGVRCCAECGQFIYLNK